MAINPNVQRIYTQDILLNPVMYAKEEGVAGRIAWVDDPVGERHGVVRMTLVKGDPKVGGSNRTEISRSQFQSEYAFLTGGGWLWWSYRLDPDWLTKKNLLLASNPKVLDYSVIINQYHPIAAEPNHFPMWSICVNEFGTVLRKWRTIGGVGFYDIVAQWPVDAIWHDMVTYVIWAPDRRGVYRLYLDNELIYEWLGPTVMPGAVAGGYFKQGVYAPGELPAGIDSLSCCVQGIKQSYPGGTGSYTECTGTIPNPQRPPNRGTPI